MISSEQVISLFIPRSFLLFTAHRPGPIDLTAS